MARSRGADVLHDFKFESAYGNVPSNTGWNRLPLVSTALGAEQNLIEDDLLGTGRETLDPTYDVTNNDGDHVVPVDVRAFGFWLKLLMGAPVTTEDDDIYTHEFTSGASTLPSASVQITHPSIPRSFVNYGAKANTCQIGLSRSGLLNASIGVIAKGESDFAGSQSGTPTELEVQRLAQAIGQVKVDGVQAGNVVSANLSFTNNLDKVEVIVPDGEIAGADESKFGASGSITVRFADMTYYNLATTKTPKPISFGWAIGDYSLLFALPRVFLPRTKRPVTGPGGIQATFNFQASGAAGHALTATLVNDVATY